MSRQSTMALSIIGLAIGGGTILGGLATPNRSTDLAAGLVLVVFSIGGLLYALRIQKATPGGAEEHATLARKQDGWLALLEASIVSPNTGEN